MTKKPNQYFTFHSPSKITQIGIFGLKIKPSGNPGRDRSAELMISLFISIKVSEWLKNSFFVKRPTWARYYKTCTAPPLLSAHVKHRSAKDFIELKKYGTMNNR
jgi:hypothetical protein